MDNKYTCLTKEQALSYIVDALDSLPADIIQMIYRVILHAESGLE